MGWRNVQLPLSLSPELQYAFNALQLELGRQFETKDRVSLKTLHTAPERPRDGDLFSADGTDWDPGSGSGLYRYEGGSYVKL